MIDFERTRKKQHLKPPKGGKPKSPAIAPLTITKERRTKHTPQELKRQDPKERNRKTLLKGVSTWLPK